MQSTAAPDHLTRILALWGAFLSTFAMGWNLYRDWLDKPKLQLSAKVRRLSVGADGQVFAVRQDMAVEATEQLYIVMTVVNVGRRPSAWKGWGGRYYKKENGKSGFTIIGRNLPKMLQEGESHNEVAELDVNAKAISENVRRLYIWDNSGHEWALTRAQLKQLRKDAHHALGPVMSKNGG